MPPRSAKVTPLEAANSGDVALLVTALSAEARRWRARDRRRHGKRLAELAHKKNRWEFWAAAARRMATAAGGDYPTARVGHEAWRRATQRAGVVADVYFYVSEALLNGRPTL